jgi:hypothetical protein
MRKKKSKVLEPEEENVFKTKFVLEYNTGFGGVDRHDQTLA